MKLKRDTEFEKGTTFHFKIDIRNLTNFELSTQKSQNVHFNGLLLSKVYITWAKKVQRSYLSWHWRVMMMKMNCFCGIVDRRNTFSLISSRDHCPRSSPSRISNTPRSGIEPTQKLSSGLVEWSCAVVKKNLKKNWLAVWKMTWGIWQIFTRSLKSVKIGTLMGSFCPKK